MLAINMLGPIHLNDYLSLWSIEVHDVVADRLLSVKLDAWTWLRPILSQSASSLSVISVPTRRPALSACDCIQSTVGQIPPNPPFSKGGTETPMFEGGQSRPPNLILTKLLNGVYSAGPTTAHIITSVTND